MLWSCVRTCTPQSTKGVFIVARKFNLWFPHFLSPTRNLRSESHNVIVEMLDPVSEALILANLAIAIFAYIMTFLVRGEKRLVKLRMAAPAYKTINLHDKELQVILGLSKRGGSGTSQKSNPRG